MSFQANEHVYVAMINDFLAKRRRVKSFTRHFMALWKKDRDEQLQMKSTWREPLDELLLTRFHAGAISAEAFSADWKKLWGYAHDEPLTNLVEKVFSACDSFSEQPIAGYYIDEARLRIDVQAAMSEYNHAQKGVAVLSGS